ncbi:hypothetical protein ANCDUO_10516 [Ancylostoma duodenale]|uniref:Peptidase M1 membrane alanine aminopeptidase domain-containing protein n=1 Tax=Ancylostoma duodenale TaxID=51022 RepID=A0A0C2GQI8_9BILA|nr:hypothetical protein ANCDUO_10516 [Ancylostoma duodenale]
MKKRKSQLSNTVRTIVVTQPHGFRWPAATPLQDGHPSGGPAPITVSTVLEVTPGTITYKKGSCLLRMLSDVMGPEVLQAGVQHHLKSHEYGVASHVDLFESLTDAAFKANVKGWCGPLNVSHLMEPYSHQTSFPLVNVHFDKNGLTLSQERYNEISTKDPAPWNYKWIIPVRTAEYNSTETRIHWIVPKELEGECPHLEQSDTLSI